MKRLIPWLAAVTILVIIFGAIYGVVQQAQRLGANNPQVQLAEDAATALNQGARPATQVSGRVNMASSLAPFTIIYTKGGRVVAGSGYLNGVIPTAPAGVLTAANGKDYSFVTWQPQNGVRIAAVSVAARNYYVVSGRSLKEVEVEEGATSRDALSGGALSLIVLMGGFVLTSGWSKRRRA